MTTLSKLQITSTLFGTVVLHSYIKRDIILHFFNYNNTLVFLIKFFLYINIIV